MIFQAKNLPSKIRFEKDSLWTFQWTNKNSIWERFALNFPVDKQKFDLRKIRLNFPIDKQAKNLFGKHSVETFPSKTKNLLEKIPLKNFREKTNSHEATTLPGENNRGWQNFTLPGRNPGVKRKYKVTTKTKNQNSTFLFKGEAPPTRQEKKWKK